MKHYTFNERGWQRFYFTRRKNALQVNANKFAKSIGLNFAYCNELQGVRKTKKGERGFSNQDVELIDEFVNTLFGTADWYNRQVLWEISKQHFFLVFSIVLLGGVPYFIAFVLPEFSNSSTDNSGGNSTAVITAQAGAVISSLIALQRTFSAWFGRRKIVGRRWRARSGIIGLIYDFENKYKYVAADDSEPINKLSPKMRSDMKKAIKETREIVDIEKQEFFDNYALPEIDVGQSLVSSQAIATKVIGAFRAPLDAANSANRERVENRRQVEKEYREVEEKVGFLQGSFDRLNAQIEKTKGLNNSSVNAHDQEILSRQVYELDEMKNEMEQWRERLLALKVEKHLLKPL